MHDRPEKIPFSEAPNVSTKHQSRRTVHHDGSNTVGNGHVHASNPGSPEGLAGLLEAAAQEVLAVTHWFDPADHGSPRQVTIRFTGRRLKLEGKPQSTDRFMHEETVDDVISGSGPIAVTARVAGIEPGEWQVTAQVLERRGGGPGSQQTNSSHATRSAGPILRLWQRWAPPVRSAVPTKTCLAPFARVPGVFPGAWGLFVALGMIFALAAQSMVIAHDQIAVGPARTVSILGIAVGIVGAKVWYVVLQRSARRMDGWCIQGFITGASGATVVLLVALGLRVGTFLDVTAPGLLIGIAVGRVGCFFAGCCGGPLTASQWGIWSSDQRIGGRRVPTQLLECVFALLVGLVTMAVILARGTAHGAFFVASVAAYTLGRQGLLRLRLLPRQTALGGAAVAVGSALALAVSVGTIVR